MTLNSRACCKDKNMLAPTYSYYSTALALAVVHGRVMVVKFMGTVSMYIYTVYQVVPSAATWEFHASTNLFLHCRHGLS